jgi:anti-anti-sigma factor
VSYSIRAHPEQDGCLIDLSGDVDSAAADDLDATLASFASDEAQLIIVDLSDANFLDSRSIGILADWQGRVRVSGGRLALAGTRPEVVRLFELIGLNEAFAFFPDVDAARAG